MSNPKSDRTSNDLVWKIVVLIGWDWNVSSTLYAIHSMVDTQAQQSTGAEYEQDHPMKNLDF